MRRRLVDDWAPPALRRLAWRYRPPSDGRAATPTPVPDGTALRSTSSAAQSRVGDDPRWSDLTERTLAAIKTCDELYQPTNFWGPGVTALLDQMGQYGLASFKRWEAGYFWFYPLYGVNQRSGRAQEMVDAIRAARIPFHENRLRRALRGYGDALRDYDAARLAWNQTNWPIDLDTIGESNVGRPVQGYQLNEHREVRFTKPYLNYMLCLAALSNHVEAPPRTFIELGGGFGVLGEFLMSRDPGARYVDFDIPPLLTVASYNLNTLFGDERVEVFDSGAAASGPLVIKQSGCMPNWRLPDLVGDYEVFVNSFSFQEMEPHVVENYIDIIARLGVKYVVSLNSRHGKNIATEADAVGVREQVISSTIIAMFEQRGYELCQRYNRPLIDAAGEIAVLRKR